MKPLFRQAWLAAAVCCLITACGTRAPSISLESAVKKGDLSSVQQHIAAGTELNAKNAAGWTALHLAAMDGNLAIVKALIGGGADVDVAGQQGKTALDLAREKGQSEIVQYLESRNESGGRRLMDGGTGVSDVLDAM